MPVFLHTNLYHFLSILIKWLEVKICKKNIICYASKLPLSTLHDLWCEWKESVGPDEEMNESMPFCDLASFDIAYVVS